MSRFAELLKDADVADVHIATDGKDKKRRRALPPQVEETKCEDTAKRATVTVHKVDDEIGVIYGWASVIEDGGQVVTDVQGDQISEPDLIKAAHGFMQNHRVGGLMHAQEDGAAVKGGDVVESLVLTRDLQKALGIDLGKSGWLIGYRPNDPKILELAKSGFLPAFSIGGRGVRKPV